MILWWVAGRQRIPCFIELSKPPRPRAGAPNATRGPPKRTRCAKHMFTRGTIQSYRLTQPDSNPGFTTKNAECGTLRFAIRSRTCKPSLVPMLGIRRRTRACRRWHDIHFRPAAIRWRELSPLYLRRPKRILVRGAPHLGDVLGARRGRR